MSSERPPIRGSEAERGDKLDYSVLRYRLVFHFLLGLLVPDRGGLDWWEQSSGEEYKDGGLTSWCKALSTAIRSVDSESSGRLSHYIHPSLSCFHSSRNHIWCRVSGTRFLPCFSNSMIIIAYLLVWT
ncbi:hypothetical protein LZ32DRAFT_602797, partial [Colletotrichum eremochloae]